MSLFNQYDSDDDDDVNEQQQPPLIDCNANVNIQKEDEEVEQLSEYEDNIEHKLSINKVSEKPYGLVMIETTTKDEEDRYTSEYENKDNTNEEILVVNGTMVINKKNMLKELYNQNNNQNNNNNNNTISYENIAIDRDKNNNNNNNMQKEISIYELPPPPTPIIYSPAHVDKLPESSNPTFSKQLYPGISTPPPHISQQRSHGGHSPKGHKDSTSNDNEVDQVIREKIQKYHKMKLEGINFNETLRKSIAFNNPSILEKLITFCGIKENGSNLSLHLYNPNQFTKDEYYEELEEIQRNQDGDKFKNKQANKNPLDSTSTTTTSSHSQENTKKKQKLDKPPASISKKIGAVISSAPTIAKKKEPAQQPPPPPQTKQQINSIFNKFKR